MGMDSATHWRVDAAGRRRLSVHIESRAGGDARLRRHAVASRRELTRDAPRRLTARYPAATLRVLALIYAHALRLKLKRGAAMPSPSARSAA